MARRNVKREYNNREIWELLCRIDRQYQPTAEELRLLETREGLLLNDKKIQFLPRSVGLLKSLKRLDLSDDPLTELPEALWTLTGLEVLNLNGTQLLALPEALGALRALRALYLEYVPITELPASVCELKKLRWLDLRGSSLRALPEEIGRLSSLRFLDLRNTQISALPEGIGRLSSLEILDLSGTRISTLPERLGELPALGYLNLNGLCLDRIPRSLALKGLPFRDMELFDGPGICVHGLTLREQKLSVFVETPKLIGGLYDEETVVLRECKVIFLGDGDSGKTYTIRRFREEGRKETAESPYTTQETPGVEILDYPVPGGEGLTLHFWDFGGQVMLHSMHRCFLTEESCYVVTVKSRETRATARAAYWLRNVQTFAPNAPVLLYVNCWENDDGRRSIDESQLRKEFPMLKGVIYCSAKDAEDAEFRGQLMEPILKMATDSELSRREVSRRWEEVRRAIRREQGNYLDKQRYHALCAKYGVEDENAPALLSFFNNLGVCFSYHVDREKKELAEYRLLKPAWLTNAIYAVIEEGRPFAVEGRIPIRAVERLLGNRPLDPVELAKRRRTDPNAVYGKEECRYVLEVAAAHELCYRVDGDRLFFPALCSSNTPEAALTEPEGYSRRAEYQFHYGYLPDNVIHRLMIRCLQKHFDITDCWLKGMIVHDTDRNRAVIRMSDDEKLILDVYSREDSRPYRLFTRLREEIQTINQSLDRQAKDYIVKRVEGETDPDEFTVVSLISAMKKDNSPVFGKSGEEYSPSELLGEFYDDWSVKLMQVEDRKIVIPVLPREFHSCSKNDPALRYALYEAYNRICPYCGEPFGAISEMQVDHVLPTRYEDRPELQDYIAFLKSCGFDLKKPDYVENYLPSHGNCNRIKSNKVNEFTLPFRHEIAFRHAKRVLELMEKRKKETV